MSLRCLLIVGGLIAVGGTLKDTDVTLSREQLDNALAICNDGSRAVFYKRYVAGSNQWIVHLQGGGWCWDQTSCASRPSTLRSSSAAPATMSFPDGSLFASRQLSPANLVFVKYCTSDAWVGNQVASASTDGMAFKGQSLVQAVFDQLGRLHGLQGADKKILFSGCSAGARGVLHNLNRVSQFMADSYKVPETVGLIDSGLFYDLHDINGDRQFEDQARAVMSYINPSIDPTCAAAHSNEVWKCLVGEYAAPTLKVEYVVNQFLADAYSLGEDWGIRPHGSAVFYPLAVIKEHSSWMTYASDIFRPRVSQLLGSLSGVGVLGASCYMHCNTEFASFSDNYTVRGTSLEDVTAALVNHQTPIRAVDTCSGLHCGLGCGPESSVIYGGRAVDKAVDKAMGHAHDALKVVDQVEGQVQAVNEIVNRGVDQFVEEVQLDPNAILEEEEEELQLDPMQS